MTQSVPLAAIFGCAGLGLSDAERRFFAETNPLGFILFQRNIDSPDQVRYLVDQMRQSVGRADAPVLIDQEGGRVQRLKPPIWRQAPAARVLGDLYQFDAVAGLRAIHLTYRLIAAELTALGIDVDCVPCIDVPVPGSHTVIGDRAYGDDPDTVAICGRAAANALLAGGVLPVAKHVPGHGRAQADSHHDLPHVATDLATLEASDFKPFRQLNDLPLGMTAHIVFDALDPDAPVTQSTAALHYIRDTIGFGGLMMTDDLSMKALGGSFEDRAALSLAAGCDLVLHCNGDMAEMQAVTQGARVMDTAAQQRWSVAATLRQPPAPFDEAAAVAELAALL